jgi:hypothetical protein
MMKLRMSARGMKIMAAVMCPALRTIENERVGFLRAATMLMPDGRALYYGVLNNSAAPGSFPNAVAIAFQTINARRGT